MRRLTQKTKNALRQVRHARVRAALKGTAQRPRLSVFRSLKSISAQLIDDERGATLCAARSAEVKDAKGKRAAAEAVGKLLAKRALEKGVKKAVFDRGGYAYRGRVEALAQGARVGGLEF